MGLRLAIFISLELSHHLMSLDQTIDSFPHFKQVCVRVECGVVPIRQRGVQVSRELAYIRPPSFSFLREW